MNSTESARTGEAREEGEGLDSMAPKGLTGPGGAATELAAGVKQGCSREAGTLYRGHPRRRR